jgi:hypothetical protein
MAAASEKTAFLTDFPAAPLVVDDVGRPMRLAGVVETVRHDDGQRIKYLRPLFSWDRAERAIVAEEVYRPSYRDPGEHDPLRTALRHTPLQVRDEEPSDD